MRCLVSFAHSASSKGTERLGMHPVFEYKTQNARRYFAEVALDEVAMIKVTQSLLI